MGRGEGVVDCDASATWKPQLDPPLPPDREAIQLYLAQRYCSRGVLSQFLDAQPDWRWCIAGEEACQVCGEPYTEARPQDLTFALKTPAGIVFTGPEEVLRQDHARDQVLDSYKRDLQAIVGRCLYCRVEGRGFEHAARKCSRQFHWINTKNKAYQARKGEGKDWIERYVACWNCYQPQDICRAADPKHEETECRFPDIVIPICYGVYKRVGGPEWV